MGLEALINTLAKHEPLDQLAYLPYSINDVAVAFGAPPAPIVSLDYVFARHNAPQNKMFSSLTGSGVFVVNANQSGIVEFGIMNGSISAGVIEVAQTLGIPFPITITDLSSGGTSSVLATACREVETPEWRREAFPGVRVYTFETPRLLIFHGIRLPQSIS
jgi:hypothetical protein